ncbi:hypothetical protein [Sporosarcina sp. FSL K6-1508]|uniref:hypothetical protein n=1 Tax=Sporosarcina sp. FSL K6-1508 TaxID=2921553 RepID=UPI0030F55AB8
MTSKTDKELAVELMIASLNHYSSLQNSNGGSVVAPLKVESIISGVENYFDAISKLESPKVEK